MTESLDGLCLSFATNGACDGLKTCALTGSGGCNVFLIAVRKSVYGVMCTVKLIATYGTVNNLVIATGLATGCGGGVFNNSCACGAYRKCIAANYTVVRLLACYALADYHAAISACVRALALSVCALSNVASVITNVILVFINVCLGINILGVGMTCVILTGICHNTLLGAGGLCCYSALIVVSKLGNGFLSNEYSLTYGAMLTLCKTCLGTGRSYSRKDFLGMSKLIDRLGVAIVTGAGEGLYALFCTGRKLCDRFDVLVRMLVAAINGIICGLIRCLTADKRKHKSTN